ncbi:MAG: hypothetical protein RRY64_10825, partial [Oscillospiraceae bacterium]
VKNISDSFGVFCPFSIVGQEVGGQWFSRQSEENGRPLGRVGNVRGWGSKTEEPPLSAILFLFLESRRVMKKKFYSIILACWERLFKSK